MQLTLSLALLLPLIHHSTAISYLRFPTTPTTGEVIPRPAEIDYKNVTLGLSHCLTFRPKYSGRCDLLRNAFDRYKTYIFAGRSTHVHRGNCRRGREPLFETLDVQLEEVDCDKYPSPDMDESYSLTLREDGTGTLSAKQVWGILRGLETFSQLTYTKDLSHTFKIRLADVKDKPRFAYRGIMLDSARHFLPLKYVLINLDLMEQNKFNVLHWHIVDDQSFPFVSKTFPDLSKKGAYTPRHVYTPRDIQKVLDYARCRGIRVVVEFDTPGHVESWGKGQPSLLTQCYDTESGKQNGKVGPIDPTLASSYDFLLALFKEVLATFPDRYTHLGGDEVPYDCWQSNPRISAFMQQMGYGTDYSKLQSYYTEKLLKLVLEARKDTGYVVWQEVFDRKNKVNNDTVVHVWKGATTWGETMAAVTKSGLRGILSSCWYLNYINYGIDWPRYYACDPQDFEGTPEQKELVMGGEACMWAEYVDASNIVPRLWPRASPVAERLWSPKELRDPLEFGGRLREHACRLLRRGYQVEPPAGPGYCDVEWE